MTYMICKITSVRFNDMYTLINNADEELTIVNCLVDASIDN